MSMVVKNNKSATNTLNTLNKNSAALSKSLKKVSTGMKINGAADDASGYAISEKMQVRIRGLDQAKANTQNASSMLKTAEGALQSTIDIMKTLKEKAINAANDTNTDADRATIQKEIDQMVAQMDDNASATFNGKILFDTSNQAAENVNQQIIKALNSEWIENSLELIKESYGMDFNEDGTTIAEMKVILEEKGTTGTLAYVEFTASGGKANSLELHVNMSYYNDMDMEDVNGLSATAGAGNYLDRTIAHEMTHAVMAANIDDMGELPLYIVEGMAELTHGADTRVYNVLKSSTQTMEQIKADYKSMFDNAKGEGTDTQHPYAYGFALLRYLANQSGGSGKEAIQRFMKTLDEKGKDGLDEAVAAASKGKFTTKQELTDSFLADIDKSTTMENFYKKYCGIDLYNVDMGPISGWDAGEKEIKSSQSTVPEGGSTKYWIYPDAATTVIDGLTVEWPVFQRKIGGWMFQTGTKSNDGIHVALNDIHAEALGVMDKDGNAIKVTTYSDAVAAIRQLDKSINRALGYQTTIGAIISRMEYTASNLTTASENTQKTDSVIRDADMAKEMTEYTKNNVLMQSAQSMLAQANQNSSAVLSLLQ